MMNKMKSLSTFLITILLNSAILLSLNNNGINANSIHRPYQNYQHHHDNNLISNNNPSSITTPPHPPPLEFAHGTTTLSFIFSTGILIAVDSRASIGNFVGSKTTQKVLPITNYILGTMAGGAADCSFWIRKLQSQARLYKLMNSSSGSSDDEEEVEVGVGYISKLLAEYLYANRHFGLSVGTMIMGYDYEHDGSYDENTNTSVVNCRTPKIYYVDNKGTRIKGDLFAVGSGSTFALGVLDTTTTTTSTTTLKQLTESEAITLGIKAIRHATFRDAYSGGYIAVYIITQDGWRKVFSEDLALSVDNK